VAEAQEAGVSPRGPTTITTSEQGRALAAKSHSNRARRRLTLDRVEAELPAMDSPEHVRAGLQRVQRWAAAGLLPGVVANSLVRAAEVWLKLHEHELDRDRVRGLERRIAELEAELAQRPAVRRVP
jgi:hypothetical protein